MKPFLTFLLLHLVITISAQQNNIVRTVNGIENVNGVGENINKNEIKTANAVVGKCAADEAKVYIMGKYPHLLHKEEAMNNGIRKIELKRNERSQEEERYISVVVHIIHNNGDENISDEQVLQGLADLNDAFANEGFYYSANGVDTHIRFCLAQQDPQGLPTTGITRDVNILTDLYMEYNDIQLKDINRWDPTQYLNIWLVANISSSSLGSGVAGYAFLPYSHGLPEDGIVNEASWFGSSADHSKVHIHEVGHYLGLYHTFEGGCANDNCTIDGDRVCDTPPDASTNSAPCSIVQNTCSTDDDDTSPNNPFRPVGLGGIGDQEDLLQDYMDYSNQSCQTLFTMGQSERMNAALEFERESLLNSSGCYSSCGIGPVTINSNTSVFLAGSAVTISQTSIAVVDVAYQWIYEGIIIANTDTLNYSFSNSQIGEGYLYLSVINDELGCSRLDSLFITVKCNPPASFTMLPQYLEVNDVATFNGFNPLATTYQWYLDGLLVNESATFNYPFNTADEHHIYLITGNGTCTDTTGIEYFAVGSCIGGQNNHWVLNQVDLDFSSGEPVATYLPIVNDNYLTSFEGLATISDQNGDLLFYCDGNKIFNKNYQPFYSGLGALGSSSQGALIVPDPANNYEYYVFTIENFAGYVTSPGYYSGTGFAYVKVDMNLNDGLGGVSANQITLIEHPAEKQCAIRHCNGHDIWVVTRENNGNSYYSYLITDLGISAPVISNVGIFINDFSGYYAVGCMKASPQGDKIAVGYYYSGGPELFHFNSNTGQLTEEYQFLNSQLSIGAYGLSFSPDGSKLYFSNSGISLYQCDLSSGNQQVIVNSIQIVGNAATIWYTGDMEIGPDGKIYWTSINNNHLDVINFPNEAGPNCGFVQDGFDLPIGIGYGLNNILASPSFASVPQITGLSQVCTATSDVHYTVGCGNNAWSLNGNNAMTIVSSTEVIIDFTIAGTDTLICTRTGACSGLQADTLLIHVGMPQVFLGNDTTICSTSSLQLYAGGQFISYSWNNGLGGQSPTVSTTGNYWVAATALGGCIARDTIHVSVFNEVFDVPEDTLLACGSGVYFNFYAPQGNFTHNWNWINGPSNDEYYLYTNGGSGPWNVPIFYTNPNGCVDEDFIVVNSRPSLPPFELETITLCEDEIGLVQLNPEDDCLYTWPDGSHSNPYSVYNTSNAPYLQFFVLRYDSICGTLEGASFQVNTPSESSLMLEDSLHICEGAVGNILYASWYFDNYEWQDGSIENTIEVTDAGIYYVNVQTPCGVFSDTTHVIYYNTSQAQLNLQDSLQVCSAQLPVLLGQFNTNLYNYQWSNGFGYYAYEEGLITVSAQNICETVYDTIYVGVTPSPTNILPQTAYVCYGDEITLSQPVDQYTVWENSIISDSLTITQNGVYSYTTSIGNNCTIADSITVFFSDLYFNISDTLLCVGDTLEIIPNTNAVAWQWLYPDFPTNVLISDTGNYYFIYSDSYCTKVEEIHIGLTNNDTYTLLLPDSIETCSAQLPIEITALGDSALQYNWSNGDDTQTAELNSSGWYFLQALYNCALKTDSTYLTVLGSPVILLPTDTTLCANEAITLSALSGYENEWSTGETTNSITVTEAGIYSLTSTTPDGCSESATVQVIASNLFANLADVVQVCSNDSILLMPNNNGESFLWSTGETSESIYASISGTYYFQATLGECSAIASIEVENWPSNEFSLGSDTIVIATEFSITIPDTYLTYQWNVPGQNSNTINVNSSGTYSLTTTDEFGCTHTDEITVIFNYPSTESFINVPEFFFMGSQGLIATYNNVEVYDIKVFDDIGRLVSYGNTFPLIWDGKVNGTTAASTMYFYIINYSDLGGNSKVKKGNALLIK